MIYIILNQQNPEFYRYEKFLDNSQDKIYFLVEASKTFNLPEALCAGNARICRVNSLDYSDVSEIVSLIVSEYGASEVRIVCTEERPILQAAVLRDAFGIAGMCYQTALGFRDKTVMKQRLADAGIRVPRFLSLKDARTYKDISDALGSTQFVAKPLLGMGSRGTYVISNEAEFSIISFDSDAGDYEFEEYIEGVMGHCDSMVVDGKICFAEVCKYPAPPLEFLNGRPTGSLLMLPEDLLRQKILDINCLVLKILNAQDCVTHMEFFVTESGDIIVIEIAARPPGGGIVPMYNRIFNFSLSELAVLQQMKPENVPAGSFINSGRYAAYFGIPRPIGLVTDVRPPVFRSKIIQHYCRVEMNKKSSASISSTDNAAFFLVESEDFEDIKADFEMIKTHTMFFC